MECYLRAISDLLPTHERTNADLVADNPGWTEESILRKTGIRSRPIAEPGQTAADLGFLAAQKLFSEHGIDRSRIDALIFISQSPDYVLPSTACLLQARLELPESLAAFDVNLGCSGFTYGAWLARSLIFSQSAQNVLLICAETYSRYCDPHDLSTITLFGDGAAAAFFTSERADAIAHIGISVLGTDGSGGKDLIVTAGGARAHAEAAVNGPSQARCNLVMNGPEVFRFALDRIKPSCEQLLRQLGLSWEQIDLVLCHQANRFMLEAVRTQLNLPAEKLPIDVENVGNLSTASLPVMIARQLRAGALNHVHTSLAVGFGVGFSWGATYIEWLLAEH